MKSTSSLWNSPNTGADNTSGFTALPGGFRNHDGSFYFIRIFAFFWSATEIDNFNAWNRNLYFYDGNVYRNINFNDDYPIILSELRDIIALDGQMSSLKVPTGYEVVLFEGENLTAPFVVLTGEIPSLFAYLFNDRAQSLTYRRKTSDESKLLPSFFNIQDFKGQETPVPYGTTVLKENFYGASIRVPDGLRVTVTTLHGARFKYEVKNVFTSDTSSVPFIGDPIVSIHVEMV
jgi:hypothetical protein